MRLRFYFRDQLLGEATSAGEQIAFRGPAVQGVKSRVIRYAQRSKLKGDALLNLVHDRTQGWTWCEKVAEPQPSVVAAKEPPDA